MAEWREVIQSAVIFQRKPWYRRWFSKEKDEPRRFYAKAVVRGGTLNIRIEDRGPDRKPAVHWFPGGAGVTYTGCQLMEYDL